MGLIFDGVWAEAGLLLATALLYAVHRVRRRYGYFRERGIFSLEPSFPFGNAAGNILARESLSDMFLRLHREMKGHRVGGAYQGLKPILLIRDPSVVYQVLVKEFSSFHDRGFKTDEKINPLEGHLFLLSGNKWRTLRNKLSPTFTSGKLKDMFPLIGACCDKLVENIDGHSSREEDLEIMDRFSCFTTDVIGSCAFGLDVNALENPNCEFRKMGDMFFKPSLTTNFKFLFRLVLPDMAIRLKLKTIPRAIEEFFFKVMRTTFELRSRPGAGKRRDFVDLLIQLREKGRIELDSRDTLDQELKVVDAWNQSTEEIELTDEILTAQAFVFFFAGFETSSTSMSMALYLLAKHQEIQGALREEVRRVKEKHGGVISYDSIAEMELLEMCLSEALRLHPPIPAILRQCTKDVVLEDGTPVEKGQQIFVSIRGLHYDPDLFPDPMTFDPYRFSKDRVIQLGSYLPFGDGPRMCIARRFARLEVKTGLANIVDNFEVTPSPKLVEPFRQNPRGFITQPLDGLRLIFKRIPLDSA